MSDDGHAMKSCGYSDGGQFVECTCGHEFVFLIDASAGPAAHHAAIDRIHAEFNEHRGRLRAPGKEEQ